jgi:hypothetical protein
VRFLSRDETVAWVRGLSVEMNDRFGTPDREPGAA